MTNQIKNMSNEELYANYHEHVARSCLITWKKYDWVLPPNDAIQIGWLALINMMKNYEPMENGTSEDFLALSGMRVSGAVKDEVRKIGGVKKVKGKEIYTIRHFELSLEDTESSRADLSLYSTDPEEPEVPLEELVGMLKDQQKEVIRGMYRYEKTMTEIAVYLNVSESRVSQIHKEALAKLRRKHGVLRYAA